MNDLAIDIVFKIGKVFDYSILIPFALSRVIDKPTFLDFLNVRVHSINMLKFRLCYNQNGLTKKIFVIFVTNSNFQY